MLKSIFTSPVLQPILMGQLRHLVTAGGTALATSGWIEGSQVSTFVGAVIALTSLALSAISKKMAA